jgi:hypothetical protein
VVHVAECKSAYRGSIPLPRSLFYQSKNKMKTLTIHNTETELEEGIFLVNPTWIHLDESEIKDKLQQGEKLFKVKVEQI